MTFSFGQLSTINGNVATVAFLASIAFVVVFDTLTSALESSLKGSVIYNSMLQRIYKELMMMGFVGFSIAMYQAGDSAHSKLTDDWLQAADFVGYILFFVAIFYVFQALYIMFLSMTMSRRYADLEMASISDILVEFKEAKKSALATFLMRFRFFPLLKVLKNVEFKISWVVFRDTYVLPSQFDYVEYLSGCLQRYALRLVHISYTGWFLVVILCLLNFLRMVFFDKKCRSGFSARDLDNEDNRESLDKCEDNQIFMFQLCGGFLVAYVVGLFFVARLYTFRIIGRAGVLGVDDYEDFLVYEEAALVEHDQRKLEAALTPAKKPRRGSVAVFKNAMDGYLQEEASKKMKRKKSRAKSIWNRISFLSKGASIDPVDRCESIDDNMSSKRDLFERVRRKIAVITTLLRISDDEPADLFRDLPEKQIKFSQDLSEIFFLNWPGLFFKAVECAIMLNSLYLSLWFCNFLTTSSDMEIVIMIVPLIVCLPVVGEVVKSASLIDCMAELNLDVIGSIIEDLEEKQQLKADIQKKLKKLPMTEDECMNSINDLFTKLADDETPDDITFVDFRNLLSSFKIHFSNRKYARVIRHTDLNTNGLINRHEMNQFLFPEKEKLSEVQRRSLMNKEHQEESRKRNNLPQQGCSSRSSSRSSGRSDCVGDPHSQRLSEAQRSLEKIESFDNNDLQK